MQWSSYGDKQPPASGSGCQAARAIAMMPVTQPVPRIRPGCSCLFARASLALEPDSGSNIGSRVMIFRLSAGPGRAQLCSISKVGCAYFCIFCICILCLHILHITAYFMHNFAYFLLRSILVGLMHIIAYILHIFAYIWIFYTAYFCIYLHI